MRRDWVNWACIHWSSEECEGIELKCINSDRAGQTEYRDVVSSGWGDGGGLKQGVTDGETVQYV